MRDLDENLVIGSVIVLVVTFFLMFLFHINQTRNESYRACLELAESVEECEGLR